MTAVVKAMANPESGLEVRDRMWLKITIPNAFIGENRVSVTTATRSPLLSFLSTPPSRYTLCTQLMCDSNARNSSRALKPEMEETHFDHLLNAQRRNDTREESRLIH